MALDLDDPNDVLVASVRAPSRAGIEALVYGGLALATYGEPHETRDADLAVSGVTATSDKLAIVSPEDFVLLEVLSTRDRDLEDARTVLRALAGRLDTDLIADEAATLAVEIADHDVLGRYRAIA
jgi:hypothetical protein